MTRDPVPLLILALVFMWIVFMGLTVWDYIRRTESLRRGVCPTCGQSVKEK